MQRSTQHSLTQGAGSVTPGCLLTLGAMCCLVKFWLFCWLMLTSFDTHYMLLSKDHAPSM